MIKDRRRVHVAFAIAVPALLAFAPRPALADFFDDARRTFKSDIPHFFTKDVPHFFQDDVPCAFGGQPTSGAKPACTAKPNTGKSGGPASSPEKPETGENPPPNPNR